MENGSITYTDKIKYYQNLWKLLPEEVPANLEFAKLVIREEPVNLYYFLGEYSHPILQWIAKCFYAGKDVDEAIREMLGDYYEFVSKPHENGKAEWKQLALYRGSNGEKLKSWLMRNSRQEFLRKKIRKDKLKERETELLDFVDYEALLAIEISDCDESDEDIIYRQRVRKAWETLSDKDKDIIHILVIDKLHWSEAFDELKQYIKPRHGGEDMFTWNNKRKQDALAMMRKRACKHLNVRFKNLK